MNQKPVKLRVPVAETDHVQGPSNAKLEVVEYGDYEGPYCASAFVVVKRLREVLGDKFKFVFRNFPLAEMHPHALSAAAAAEAAGLQGRFWEMHDMLYANQDSLDERSLLAYADALNLDLARFAEDLTSPEMQDRIMRDQYVGARSGVNKTPTFYVNGVRYDGDWSYEPFLRFLETTLRGSSERELDQAG